jgi:hypothetical protein
MVLRGVVAFLVALLASQAVFCAELKLKPPAKPFDAYPIPPAPNYNDPKAWAVWPGRPSMADVIPPDLDAAIASEAKADVFFIHPTTYLTNDSWNARYDEPGFTGAQLDSGVLRYQVSIFNGCCRMYAPRYRQSTLSAFVNPGADANKAFDLAYSDVIAAFDYYILNENTGRPFILASHSQGSLHATRLLQERIAARPNLRSRLIAAYVVGASLPEAAEHTGLPVCSTPRQTGCLIDWNSATALTPLALGRGLMVTFSEGRYQLVGRKRWLCVNPLSWDRTTVSPASANKGALPIVDHGNDLKPLVRGVTGAKCNRGRLVISIPRSKREGFKDPMTSLGSYHNQDYSLFYESIRRNAIARVDAFDAK